MDLLKTDIISLASENRLYTLSKGVQAQELYVCEADFMLRLNFLHSRIGAQ